MLCDSILVSIVHKNRWKLKHLTLLLKLVIKSDDFVLVVKVKTFSAVLFLMNLEIV